MTHADTRAARQRMRRTAPANPTRHPHRLYDDPSVTAMQQQLDDPLRAFNRVEGPPDPALIQSIQRKITRELKNARRPLHFIELAKHFNHYPNKTGWSRRDWLATALADLMDQPDKLLTNWHNVDGWTLIRFTLPRDPNADRRLPLVMH